MPHPARPDRSRPATAGRPTGLRALRDRLAAPGPTRRIRLAARGPALRDWLAARGLALRGRLAAGGAERGANPVELAVVMPAILVLLFASIQLAVWFVARSTALNAAQAGVNAQRALQAPPGAGRDRASTFLRAAGDWLVDWQRPGPACTATATEVSCTVSGRSLSVIPGVHFPVRQSAHGTVERWTVG